MRKIAFNDGWTCRHAGDSGKGKPVTIPHDAMLDEKRTQESLGGINIGWFEGFDYVYEKEFSVPQEYEDFRLVFEFEGVYRNAESVSQREKSRISSVWIYKFLRRGK